LAEAVRIISRLDIKGPNLVKGIHLEGLRVMGDPDQFATFYYENGADELFYMDVVASLYERNSLHQIISKIAKNIFIPITVGGGLRSLDDMSAVLKSGADKVCLNTAAIRNPLLIKEAAKKFGSSTIVVALEVIKQTNGEYLCFVDNGREHTGVNAFEWAKKVEMLGAGEIVLTSVDRDGTGDGFDIDLIKKISQDISIPIVAHGGAGSPEDVARVIKEADVGAVAIASITHYDCLSKNIFETTNKNQEGNKTFLLSQKSYSKIKNFSFAEIKNHLQSVGVNCRALL
jgi:cyclase